MNYRIVPYGGILNTNQCVWCHSDFSKRKKYAFNLCVRCYRWYRRYINKEIKTCILCDKLIKVYQGDFCVECKKRINIVNATKKRESNIKSKFLDFAPIFDELDSIEDAKDMFSPFFSSRQEKLLDIALERYFEGTPLREIGERYNCTREYIRQCETQALKIIAQNISAV